jgi:hypothetical protein
LKALFVCEKAQFNHNHAAIARLLSSDTAAACITTNYDNGIESAFPTLEVYVYPNFPSQEIFAGVPSLLKIHGDVITNSYIATLPEMFTARHDYLRELLSHKKVLVVGYSGYGDLDIAPCLEDLARTARTTFVWCFNSKQPSRIPSYAQYGFGCDLRYDNSELNPLIGLAGGDRQLFIKNGGPSLSAWQAHVDQWFQEIGSEKLKKMITRTSPITKGGWAWPYLHLHYVKHWQQDKQDNKTRAEIAWDRARASIDVGLYFSAQQALREFEEARHTDNGELSPSEKTELSFWRSFIDWRLGNFTAAMDSLRIFYDLDWSKSPSDKELISNGLRVYLEG